MSTITYKTGDATAPQGEGKKIICHVCNDVGGWGAGFVLAISKKWPQPEQAYRKWYRAVKPEPLPQGDVQFVPVTDDIMVANMIGQKGLYPEKGVPPLRYESVERALTQVAEMAKKTGASVHMPRIGCGLAGGKWEKVESIIQKTLIENGIEVVVYDFK